MTQKIVSIVGLAAALLLAPLGTAAADDDYKDPRVGLHFKVSTLGIGGEVSTPINEWLGVRAGIYGFGTGVTTTADGIDYDLDAGLLNIGGYVDIHPFKNGFRLTGGLIWNDNSVDGSAISGQNLSIGDTVYTPEEVGQLNGVITTNNFAPFIGIGWGGTAIGDSGWSFSVEIGAAFHGTPEAVLTPVIPPDSPLNLDPQLIADLEADIDTEVEAFQDDIADFSVYPVVSLGLTYRF